MCLGREGATVLSELLKNNTTLTVLNMDGRVVLRESLITILHEYSTQIIGLEQKELVHYVQCSGITQH